MIQQLGILPANVPIPPLGSVIYFCDSSNSNKWSKKLSTGAVSTVEGCNAIEVLIEGDGVTTNFTVIHNFNNRVVQVQVIEDFGDYEKVNVGWRASTADEVICSFAVAPAIGINYKVSVQGNIL